MDILKEHINVLEKHINVLNNLLGRNEKDEPKIIRNENRMIKVRFPSIAGDTDRLMTIQELKEDYKGYLIIDPKVGEQVDIEKLANLEDIEEIVAMPPISGG